MTSHPTHIWSFDVGTGSFGIAVRHGNDFKEVKSLLIPDGFASIEDSRKRRRMARTREAHQAREEWLRRSFLISGLKDAILIGRRATKNSEASSTHKQKWVIRGGDYRLEREFPPSPGQRTQDGAPSDVPGSSLCYNSAVLRIRLLQDQPLAPWQIFKALHSAIQKRGYDPDLPWKAQERSKSAKPDDDEKTTMSRVNEAQKELEELPEDCQLPCYLEAQLTGLWHPADPTHTELRQKHSAESTRQRIYLRHTVEAEIHALIDAAVKQLPALAPHSEEILYGPAQAAYASYNNLEARTLFEATTGVPLIRGKATDWQGVLSQKIPTFDNRALSSCSLIPRFHAAKSEPKIRQDGTFDPDSLLPAEVTFLMKLKNLRFALAGGNTASFSVAHLRDIFEDRAREVMLKKDTGAYKLTKIQLQKTVERCGGCGLLPNQIEIEASRLSGRSRFSKPALKLVKKLILSGKAPSEIHKEALTGTGGNVDPLKGIIPADLQFLRNIKSSGGNDATWENFYLPDESLSFVENAGVSTAAKIRSLIGRQNNPIVRHRLETFWKLLQELQEKHGKPERIAIEFVREDFMGEKAKMELAKFQKERREARAEGRKEAGPGKDGLRYQLLKDQGFVCMYCEGPLGLADLPNCHLDHIVPDKMGGPGAYWNFALCCASCNSAKAKRTPWQWFHEDHRAGWDPYVARIRARTFQLRNKKVRLLTDEDAPAQVQRYQTLAETAWIARLAQMLVCLHFDWPRNFAGGPRHVIVLPGGLTARVRRKYGLNALLGQDIAALELKLKGDANANAKVEAEIDKKCRADKRHHALDAMVLSFLPQWTSDPTKQVSVKLPEGINIASFERVLKDVEPTFIATKKPVLRDTIYASRNMKGTSVAASRFEISKLGYGTQTPDGKLKDFSPKRLKKQSQEILDSAISKAIGDFADQNPSADEWAAFAFQLKSSPNGPVVRKAMRLSNKPNLSNYKDLSKDGNGAWRTSKEGHRGQLVYVTAHGEPKVVPVLVFESPGNVRRKVRRRSDFAEVVGFFESLCCIELTTEAEHSSKKIPPGRYTLRTLQSDGRASFDSAGGQKFDDIPLKKLLPCGFARV